MLFLYAGTASTPPAGRALLCSITAPVERATDGTPLYLWAPATGMPGGPARYLPHQAAPGVYAVDAPADKAASVYRMNSGMTDAGQPIAWQWQDRWRMDPDPTAYKSVQRA